MINERLKRLFAAEGARYTLVAHEPAYTAQQAAAVSHVPGRELAKAVVLVDAGGDPVMFVVPAPLRVDLSAAALATGRVGLRLATEAELARLFPDCEPGAMPPFAELYNVPLYADACLRREPEVFFQAGNHRELVEMVYDEWERLARPIVGQLCFHRATPARRAG